MKTMREKMNELIKEIPLNELELRIGSVKKNEGFSLLAYKDSRADVKRFNSVFGSKWYPKYHYDKKDLLVCTIYVWDDEIQQWIGREDVGMESYTEKEKGSYSDALKRAGFRWGFGIELYDMPFIWIKWDKWNDKGQPKAYTKDWKLINNGNKIEVVNEIGTCLWGKILKKKEVKEIIEEYKQEKKEKPLDIVSLHKILENANIDLIDFQGKYKIEDENIKYLDIEKVKSMIKIYQYCTNNKLSIKNYVSTIKTEDEKKKEIIKLIKNFIGV